MSANGVLNEWATVSEEGVASGRALELCLLARRCLAMLASARCTMRDAMPKAVELARRRV